MVKPPSSSSVSQGQTSEPSSPKKTHYFESYLLPALSSFLPNPDHLLPALSSYFANLLKGSLLFATASFHCVSHAVHDDASELRREVLRFLKKQWYVAFGIVGVVLLLGAPVLAAIGFILTSVKYVLWIFGLHDYGGHDVADVSETIIFSQNILGPTYWAGLVLSQAKMLLLFSSFVQFLVVRQFSVTAAENCFFSGVRVCLDNSKWSDEGTAGSKGREKNAAGEAGSSDERRSQLAIISQNLAALQSLPLPTTKEYIRDFGCDQAWNFVKAAFLFLLHLTPGISFFVYPSTKLFLLRKKLGFQRALFVSALSCVPGVRTLMHGLVQMFGGGLGICKELLYPASARLDKWRKAGTLLVTRPG